ncbi:uncharacterized protein LOC128953295 isoform X1 [Oppia nitens]|uniref:uncharacterized protein LOC128953295 isoform X1 n=1 Tax=Oppia nitens TaxID=1686743 RepID=UPI0023DC4BB6|nr:uncharacterized protein LOC128953295 isoform X1 [Oppia nitens]
MNLLVNAIIALLTIIVYINGSVYGKNQWPPNHGKCPVNGNLWPQLPDYAGLATIKLLSDGQLVQSLHRSVEKQCRYTDRKGRQYKQEGLELLASRYVPFCQVSRDFFRQMLATIANQTDSQKRHELLARRAQWEVYWSKYYAEITAKQSCCSLEQLGYSKDVNVLVKQLAEKRSIILDNLPKFIKEIKQNNDQLAWPELNDETVEQTKADYANTDKIVANLTPESIKIKTLQNLVYEADIYGRAMKGVKL